MVAELAGISTSTIDRRASSTVAGIFAEQRGRPKWIQTATREPIYSVLDSNEIVSQSPPLAVLGKVVIIRAVKKDELKSETLEDEQRELSYVRNVPEQNGRSSRLEVENEDNLYSVVSKCKKIRLPETSSSDEEAIRPVDQTQIERSILANLGEKLQPEDPSKRVEVRKWLRDTPAMYSDRTPDYENPWHEREAAAIALPKGVVGLVGPYRVYRNPNERREYMLQEEELIEETVQDENTGEHRSRAKWRIREDDEATLVPNIRDLPGLEGFVETKMEDRERESELEPAMKMEKSACVGGTAFRGEERSTDVPDTVSAVSSATSMRDKGEKELVLRTSHFNHFKNDQDAFRVSGSCFGNCWSNMTFII